MAGASERSLPHCHGGGGARRLGSRGSSGSLLSAAAPLAPHGPRPDALTRGLGRETEKGSQSGGTEVRKRLGTGQGVCDRGPTAPEGGRGREGESRGGGEQGNRQPRPAPSTPLPAGSDDSNDAERQSEVTIRPEGKFARQKRLNGTTRTATRRREIST